MAAWARLHLGEAGAGPVDAAAAGFLLVLDSLAAVVAGDPLPEPPQDPSPADGSARTAPSGQRFSSQNLGNEQISA